MVALGFGKFARADHIFALERLPHERRELRLGLCNVVVRGTLPGILHMVILDDHVPLCQFPIL